MSECPYSFKVGGEIVCRLNQYNKAKKRRLLDCDEARRNECAEAWQTRSDSQLTTGTGKTTIPTKIDNR